MKLLVVLVVKYITIITSINSNSIHSNSIHSNNSSGNSNSSNSSCINICNKGTYCSNSICTICDEGYYCNSDTTITTTTTTTTTTNDRIQCPIGTTSLLGSRSIDDCFSYPIIVSHGDTTTSFSCTESMQQYIVPSNTYGLLVNMTGSSGSISGGLGGFISCEIPVTPNQILYVNVGCAGSSNTGGYNGGGNGITSSCQSGGGGTIYYCYYCFIIVIIIIRGRSF